MEFDIGEDLNGACEEIGGEIRQYGNDEVCHFETEVNGQSSDHILYEFDEMMGVVENVPDNYPRDKEIKSQGYSAVTVTETGYSDPTPVIVEKVDGYSSVIRGNKNQIQLRL